MSWCTPPMLCAIYYCGSCGPIVLRVHVLHIYSALYSFCPCSIYMSGCAVMRTEMWQPFNYQQGNIIMTHTCSRGTTWNNISVAVCYHLSWMNLGAVVVHWFAKFSQWSRLIHTVSCIQQLHCTTRKELTSLLSEAENRYCRTVANCVWCNHCHIVWNVGSWT